MNSPASSSGEIDVFLESSNLQKLKKRCDSDIMEDFILDIGKILRGFFMAYVWVSAFWTSACACHR